MLSFLNYYGGTAKITIFVTLNILSWKHLLKFSSILSSGTNAASNLFTLVQFRGQRGKRRAFYLRKDLQKKSLPLRMQAFERIIMLLERVTPNHLVIRLSQQHDYRAIPQSIG